MKKFLLNRKPANWTNVSIKHEVVNRKQVVAAFGEEKVVEMERMYMLEMQPMLVIQYSKWDRIKRVLGMVRDLFYTTDEVAIHMTNEIIAEHAPKILEQLGLADNNDGILDRIAVTTELPDRDDAAVAKFCHNSIIKGLFGVNGARYEEGSGRIEIRALSPFVMITKKGIRKRMDFTRLFFFRPLLRKYLINTLAHEMKHYQQYLSGEAYKHMSGVLNFTPYHWRWEEQDANQFAREYIRSL